MSEGNDDILYSDEEELFNTKNDFNYSIAGNLNTRDPEIMSITLKVKPIIFCIKYYFFF